MTRLPLALVGLLSALMATIASAQSYPQPSYAMYGPGSPYGSGPMSGQGPMPQGAYGPPGMSAAAYGYGPMNSGMYPNMQAAYNYGPSQSEMNPNAPAGPAYPGPGNSAGYANGNGANGYGPPQNQSAAMGQQNPYPQEYHGPQGQIAKASPPPMKLPPGVTSENGLLYYKGSAHADVNFQQFPAGSQSGNPYRMAAYQGGPESAGAAPSSVMTGGPNQAPQGMPMGEGGGAQDGGQGYGQCQQGGNQCDDNGYGCGLCNWFNGLCHGSMFPGKLGYVWSGGYDNLAMTRNAGTGRTLLLTDNFDGTFTPTFNSDQLQFDWDYGGRAHVELIGPSGVTYQATYMRIATFVSQSSVIGSANLTVPGNLGNFSGFFDVDSASFRYDSAIQTGELNMIFPFGSFEFLAGYRYMQIDELSQIATTSSLVGNSFFNAASSNQMNGGQIGILGRWQMFGMFDFDFDAKFGVMGDAAREHQLAFDPIDTTIGEASGTKTRVAFVSELGLQGVVPLGSSVSFHAGYNVFFIDRVALAPDQFDFNIGSSSLAGTHVNNHGDIVLQGVNCGFTFVW